MDALGWDACDVILVTGDAYIDHPSFGMALVGRLLESQGFRVGVISQPDWTSAEAFRALGRPRLYFGVTAGNMDSMINRYTADRKIRSDDAYTANAEANRRPDRAVVGISQRVREAYPGVNVVIGSIEASLRRIAHYDYWSDKVRRSVLPDSKADILLFGNAERALVALTQRLAAGEPIAQIRDLRGTAFMVKQGWLPGEDWTLQDSTEVDRPGRIDAHPDPMRWSRRAASPMRMAARRSASFRSPNASPRENPPANAARSACRHTSRSRTIQYFTRMPRGCCTWNPTRKRPRVGAGSRGARCGLNPPPIPLETADMDYVYGLAYARQPHPSYGNAHIPAWEMIRFSINIMRGCFGGCTFCSITEHEGASSRAAPKPPSCARSKRSATARRVSRGISPTLAGRPPTCTGWPARIPRSNIRAGAPVLRLSRYLREPRHRPRTLDRALPQGPRNPGVKRISIGSGLRYDLAVRSPEYVKELVTHHVSGLLKIAPEHTEDGPLSRMMKPGIGSLRALQGNVREVLEGRRARSST